MSSIPLPPIIHSLIDPLRHALQDSDPYVRKTAAIACDFSAHVHEGDAESCSVAKLYASEFGKRTVEKEGFVAMLRWASADVAQSEGQLTNV
jgi:hypothetical protein